MKVGDLVRFQQTKRRFCGDYRGCLPYLEDDWGCGLVQDTNTGDGNILILWPEKGIVLTDPRFLEVVEDQ